jgi:hypothetical protein
MLRCSLYHLNSWCCPDSDRMIVYSLDLSSLFAEALNRIKVQVSSTEALNRIEIQVSFKEALNRIDVQVSFKEALDRLLFVSSDEHRKIDRCVD